MVDRVFVDSNIIIDSLRGNEGDFSNLLKLQEKGKIELFISSVTVFELFSGKSSKTESIILRELLSKLEIISFDEQLAELTGEINRDNGPFSGLADLIIGNTCQTINAKLITRNKKHFQNIPRLKFFDFSSASS